MNSLPIPSSQTPLLHLDARCLLLAACCGLSMGSAWAHDAALTVPDELGWRIGAGVALADVQADQALPSQRFSGYLLRGDMGVDRRVSALEHGVLEAGWRFHPQWSVYAAVGQHDSDPAHTEAAWVRYEFEKTDVQSASVMLGRTQPEWGPVMSNAGHMDRLALMPLAKRAVFDGDTLQDGVQFTGQREWGAWTAYGDVGVWQGKQFPAAQGSAVAPSVHVGLMQGDWRADAFAVAFAPDGRGALVQSPNGAHTHNSPDCSSVSKGVLCFTGDSPVAGVSLQWASHVWPLTVQGAYWLRRDSGILQSVNGQAEHTGRYMGGWLEGWWQPWAAWELGVRHERQKASFELAGPGAHLLTEEAGLLDSQPISRNTLAVRWKPQAQLTISAEAGQETQGPQKVNFTVLRLVWLTDKVFGGDR